MSTTHRFIALVLGPAVCDECGRECPERYEVVESRATGERLRLGSACAWKVAGVKPTDRPESAKDDGTIGEVPEWMLGL